MPTLLFTSIGRPSRHLITVLLSLPDCPSIRVLVRSSVNVRESLPPPLWSAPHSIVVADDWEGLAFQSAFQGVSTIFHNGTDIHTQERFLSMAIIDMAKEAEVKHFVLCSVFHSIRTKIHTHQVKLMIEEYLVESRLNYTILQPATFMQDVGVASAMRTGIIQLGFSTSIVTGFVDLIDLAIVARNIILSPTQHYLAQYELVGQNVTYDDISRTIARVCRMDIQCNVFSSKEFIGRIMYGRGGRGLAGNTNTLRWLLGRDPTTWEGHIRREVANV
ncbi:NAD(P)-binding protein [Ramaria rubella]|nr:NAD(P)-binding protein [Ramaria rubella]